ncbi:NAD(P)-dependent alcohol dehydrogenase [Actinoplanes sp. NPDC000266]
MGEMRAAIYDRYGPPEVLRIANVERPQPREGEVLVRVLTTSLNGGEIQGRSGRLRLVLGNRFPQRTGIDLVGEVVETGAGVQDMRSGQRVWGISENPIGTTAEYFAIRRSRLSAAPAGLTAAEAVTLLAGGTTALTALREKAALKSGERLLVRGAAGGVGSLAVQIGKLLGAHVTATARTSAIDFARSLGADHVIDYTRVPLAEFGRFDVVLDTSGVDHRALRRLLNPGGRMVAITIDMQRRLASLAYLLISTIHGPRRVRIFRGDPTPTLLTELAAMAERGDVRPVIDQVFPFDGIIAAHHAVEAGGVRGKHVIEIARPS